jgi:hypothetical protein
MVCPEPSVDLAVAGAAHLSPEMMMGVAELATLLGVTRLPGTLNIGGSPVSGSVHTFTGPLAGASVNEEPSSCPDSHPTALSWKEL